MQGFLTLISQALGFGDPQPNNDPQLRYLDWKRNYQAIPCANPGRSPPGTLPAGQSVVVFDGTRALTVDGTTAFTVTLSPLDSGTRYRFTWSGGTNPSLRTDRGLTLSGSTVTVNILANNAADVTISAGIFGTTAVGDTVFIPGTTTGDAAGPFNALNEGFWVVIAVLSTTHIQMQRPVGASFSGASEAPVLAANSQLQAFSAAGVQPADSISITAGFSLTNQKSFVVDRVTSTWWEVISSTPLALDVAVHPGAAGIAFYSTVKRWIRVESDQQAVVQLNSDTSSVNTVLPVVPGDLMNMGWVDKWGAHYKVTIVNQSPVAMNFNVFSAE